MKSFGLRPGQGGRAAPLDPPVRYVTVPAHTVWRVGLVCSVVGVMLGVVLTIMLTGGPS